MKKYLTALCIATLLSGCITTAYYQADKCRTKREYFKAVGPPWKVAAAYTAKNGQIVEVFIFKRFIIDEMHGVRWAAIFVNDKFYSSASRAFDIEDVLFNELGIDPRRDEKLYGLIHLLDVPPPNEDKVRLDAYQRPK